MESLISFQPKRKTLMSASTRKSKADPEARLQKVQARLVEIRRAMDGPAIVPVQASRRPSHRRPVLRSGIRKLNRPLNRLVVRMLPGNRRPRRVNLLAIAAWCANEVVRFHERHPDLFPSPQEERRRAAEARFQRELNEALDKVYGPAREAGEAGLPSPREKW